MYENRIKHLTESHHLLDKQIADMERNHPHVEENKLHEMKKQKLMLKDEIARLKRLQYEHDQESLDHWEEDERR
jgi:uncharacterized protein YdcH (DUF465 family)